jgi:hypothetical protein
VLPKVNDLIRADQRLTVMEVSEELGISSGSCQAILTKDLCMRRVSSKFVPQLMTAEQQQHHLSVASDLQKQTKIYKHCKWK